MNDWVKGTLGVSVLVSCSALAQDAPGDAFSDTGTQVIPEAIHATRLDYSKYDSPEAVTVITQEDIRRAGYLDVSEIFRSVPGFRVSRTGVEVRVSYHGTTSRQQRRMKVSIDGRSVLIGDGQYVEFDKLPVELDDITRIVVTRGANGAAYGDNAFFASIDFQTAGRDDPHVVNARAGVGTNGRRRYSVSANEEIAGFAFTLSAGKQTDGGYDTWGEAKNPLDDGREIKRSRLSVQKEFSQGSVWKLDANAYDADQHGMIDGFRFTRVQHNDGNFLALSNQRELSETSRLDWFASYNNQRETSRNFGCYTPDTLAAIPQTITDPTRQQLALALASIMPFIINAAPSDTCYYTDLGIKSSRTETELQYEYRYAGARYLLGASGTWITAESPQYFAGNPQHQRSGRVFGESDYAWHALHFSGGLMAQKASNIDSNQYAWRGAISWQVQPNQALRYSYSDGTRAPSLVESETLWTGSFVFGRRNDPIGTYNYVVPFPLITNPVRLKPERIQEHSIGYFGRFAAPATVDIKVFHETITNPVESNLFYFSAPAFNGPAFTLTGIETELSYRLSKQWLLSGQYSHIHNDAADPLERSLHADDAGSVSVSFMPLVRQALTLSLYGNSALAGNDYRRYDFAYTYNRSIGHSNLRIQGVWQHHVNEFEGSRGATPAQSQLRSLDAKNQYFLMADLSF